MRARSAVVVAALTVGVGVTGAGVAAAQSSTQAPPSGSVTITLSAEQVNRICTVRIPKIEQRADRLVARINGGAETKGSVAWLKARADKEQAAGRTTTANLLKERADRRAGRVDDLNKAKQRAEDFKGKYCGSK
ncbi:hypothetical protein [Actinokineospora inagensis]|uniref:hypothetical protein n=1 Tax=Actinokineospora inagensis TaxID=103730 RepID=UPI000427A8C3|nr:hypothetical protein [Actinokineospora inagensis]